MSSLRGLSPKEPPGADNYRRSREVKVFSRNQENHGNREINLREKRANNDKREWPKLAGPGNDSELCGGEEKA